MLSLLHLHHLATCGFLSDEGFVRHLILVCSDILGCYIGEQLSYLLLGRMHEALLLGEHSHHHEVRVAHEACHHLVHKLYGEIGCILAHDRVFDLNARHGLIVDEVAHILLAVALASHLSTLVVSALKVGEILGTCAHIF